MRQAIAAAVSHSWQTIPHFSVTVNDPLIDEAAVASYDYDSTLPNFICDEIVTRFMSDAKPPKWKKKEGEGEKDGA